MSVMVWSHSGQPGEGVMEDDEATDSEDEEEGALFLWRGFTTQISSL